MWRADKGAWFDWDMMNKKHRESFYLSNIVPLWTGSYDIPNDVVATAVIRYLMDEKVINSDLSVTFNGKFYKFIVLLGENKRNAPNTLSVMLYIEPITRKSISLYINGFISYFSHGRCIDNIKSNNNIYSKIRYNPTYKCSY